MKRWELETWNEHDRMWRTPVRPILCWTRRGAERKAQRMTNLARLSPYGIRYAAVRR